MNYFLIETQSDLDEFIDRYGHCSEIKGNLAIYDPNITDYSDFDFIEKIDSLAIGESLQSEINGFNNLKECSHLQFSLGEFTDISGFNKLEKVDKLRISRCVNHSSITGMKNLDSIGHLSLTPGVRLIHTPYIQMTSFPAVRNIHLVNIQNSNYKDLDFLRGVDTIVALNLKNNRLLSDISMVEKSFRPHLPSPWGRLLLDLNDSLSYCHIEPICHYMQNNDGYFIRLNGEGCKGPAQILSQCDVIDLCTYHDPNGDNTIRLTTQAEVDSFAMEYAHCFHIPSHFYIDGDLDLSGLSHITKVQSLTIANRTDEDFIYFDSLTYSKSVSFIDIPNLTKVSGLNRLVHCDTLQFVNSPNIYDLLSLNNIKTLKHLNFDGWNRDGLLGLDSLHTIESHFRLNNCNNITDLSPFKNILRINNTFTIQNNENLESLMDFDLQVWNISEVNIVGNPKLNTCDINPICYTFLHAPFKMYNVTDNDEDCNSVETIITQCGITAVEDHQPILNINIFPNPVDHTLYIESDHLISDIKIYNAIGQLVLSDNYRNNIDVSHLKKGIHFIIVTAHNQNTTTKKILIQ